MPTPPATPPSQVQAFIVGLVLLLTGLVGCRQVPVDVAAPVLAPPAGSGVTAERLDSGRAVYIGETKCARCHSPKPVAEYPATAWEKDILPRMAKKSKLTADEYESVLAYVTAGAKGVPTPR